ncbi:SDR family oxidoreductase [Arthrobacter sp. zg-ZUI100]|uniref:SDR family oxidoreductase n=1 Tax=Arthrobacter jiangjiafuii TaxID=2817475 RepID=UPI001AEDEAAB|nr:SDR family NAD(P)-dependent oxidoreductase [Arthrobacter jiangjiafuii]MBP3036342.1 SDR family oxidoreductase [Arthrobacter jiangjiafuii]
MNIRGAVCIVTGGSSGLGRATAEYFAAAGARVVTFDVKPPSATAEDGIHSFVVDVTDEAAVANTMDEVGERFGGIHIVINCAGMIRGHEVLGEEGIFPIDLFRHTVDVNLTGTFIVLAHGARWMSQNDPGEDGERGVIVNTASIAALGASSSAAYAASKGGIVSMALTIARQLAPYGIRINTIAPGLMDTDMFGDLPVEHVIGLREKTLFPRRLGQPEEFARLACHLVENTYLNAAVVRLDSGTTT